MHAQQGRRTAVAAVPAAQRLEAGEPAPLAFVERADEGLQGGAEIAARRGVAHRQRLELLPSLACGALAVAPGVLGGCVPVVPGALFAGHVAAAGELAEGLAGAHLEQGVEFLDAVAGGGVLDEGGEGLEEVAVGGEAHAAEGPQAVGIEVGAASEDVEAAVVGVAGVMGQLVQQPHGGALGRRAEGLHELGKGGDGLALQQVGEGVGGVLGSPHGVVVALAVPVTTP